MLKTKIPLRVQNLSRLRVVYDVTRELARDFGAQTRDLEIIRKGILERQILDEIILYYRSFDNEFVCKVTIAIDWKAHQISASSDEGKTFAINPEHSLAEQLSEIFPILTEHVKDICDFYHVIEIEVRYGYKDEIWADPKKLAEAREYLGLRPGDTIKLSGLNYEENFYTDQLQELGIKIEHR